MFGINKCPICDGVDFVFNRSTGELVCKGCGYVLKTMNIDFGPEWRSFEGEEDHRARTGPPQSLLVADKGISSTLGTLYEDRLRRGVSSGREEEIQRVKSWIRRTTESSADKNLQTALSILQKLGESLNMPRNVLERAAQIYRLALDKNLVRGRAITSIVAAALYLALREFQIPRTFKNIVKQLGIDSKELGRCYRLLARELNIKLPVVEHSLYIRSIASKAGLPPEVIVTAEKILRIAKDARLTIGKDPVGLAAAATYFAALLNGHKITQKDIANAADVTEVTIRNRCRHLMDNLGFKSLSELSELLKRYEEGSRVKEAILRKAAR